MGVWKARRLEDLVEPGVVELVLEVQRWLEERDEEEEGGDDFLASRQRRRGDRDCILTKVVDHVYRFPFFRREICEELLQEIEAFLDWQSAAIRAACGDEGRLCVSVTDFLFPSLRGYSRPTRVSSERWEQEDADDLVLSNSC